MIEQDEALGELLNVVEQQEGNLQQGNGYIFKSIECRSILKHGINPTVVIFDELHAQPNRELWDIMTFGAGSARKRTLWWVITTAGNDPDRNSIGWEIHEKS